MPIMACCDAIYATDYRPALLHRRLQLGDRRGLHLFVYDGHDHDGWQTRIIRGGSHHPSTIDQTRHGADQSTSNYTASPTQTIAEWKRRR
jgi:hypothetical protein